MIKYFLYPAVDSITFEGTIVNNYPINILNIIYYNKSKKEIVGTPKCGKNGIYTNEIKKSNLPCISFRMVGLLPNEDQINWVYSNSEIRDTEWLKLKNILEIQEINLNKPIKGGDNTILLAKNDEDETDYYYEKKAQEEEDN